MSNPAVYASLSQEAQRMVDEGRARFRDEVGAKILQAERLSVAFEEVIGEVSASEALDAWKRVVITTLREGLA